MTTPLNTAHAFLNAMEKMDYNSALEHVADDVEYINGAATAVTGHEGILNTLKPFFDPLKENRFEVLREAANGNTVFIERLDHHHAEHGWFSLPVNAVMEIENGKIQFWREYFDMAIIQDDLVKLTGGA